MIQVTCEHCGASMKAPDKMTGRKAACKKCGKPIVVENASKEPAKPSVKKPRVVQPRALPPEDLAESFGDDSHDSTPEECEKPASVNQIKKLIALGLDPEDGMA